MIRKFLCLELPSEFPANLFLSQLYDMVSAVILTYFKSDSSTFTSTVCEKILKLKLLIKLFYSYIGKLT